MALPAPIDLLPTGLPGGLLAAASSLPGGWENGVEFLSDGCLTPERVAVCPDERYEGDLDAVGSVAFQPFDMRQGVKCSTLARLDVASVASLTLGVTDEYLMGMELQDGLASGNPCLNDAVSLGTALDPEAGIALIEAAGCTALAGRLIVIHVPPSLAIYLPEVCYRDAQGNWRTPLGSLVIMSPGYTGTTVYGTGEVYAAVGALDPKVTTDRALNVDEGMVDRPGIVVFDPCWIVSVDTPEESPAQ